MARGKPLDFEKRIMIISYYKGGEKVHKIAKKVNLSWTSVKSVIQHYEKTHSYLPCRKPGRPRKTTTRNDRKIINLALQNRRVTLKALGKSVRQNYGIQLSDESIKKRLHDAKLYGRAARKKPLLLKRHRDARLKWCRERRSWSAKDWEKVLWSDESKFCLVGSAGCQRVWRRPGEALKPSCVNSTVKHGGGRSLNQANVCAT